MTDMNKLTKVYIKIRDARSKLKKDWEQQDAALKEKLERLEGEMLRFLNDTQQNSSKTDSGIVYRQEEITPTGADWNAFYQWVKDHDAFDALERRIKKTFVKEYMDANGGGIPPGVSVYREYVVRVRRA
jgi:hypothetical protein